MMAHTIMTASEIEMVPTNLPDVTWHGVFGVDSATRLEGPGLRRWMDVMDSEQELTEFMCKCHELGYFEPISLEFPKAYGIKSCDAKEFKITDSR